MTSGISRDMDDRGYQEAMDISLTLGEGNKADLETQRPRHSHLMSHVLQVQFNSCRVRWANGHVATWYSARENRVKYDNTLLSHVSRTYT